MKQIVAAFAVGFLAVAPAALAWQSYSPERVSQVNPALDVANTAPYSSAGYVKSFLAGREFGGSAAVGQDPRLIFTCAHVLFERGRWADLVGFLRSLNSEHEPDDSQTVFVRGFYRFSGYTGSKKAGYDFDLDFAVAYARSGEVFGTSALPLNDGPPGDPDGLDNLTAPTTTKMILGYPAYLDANPLVEGLSFMHQTGPFENAGPAGEAFYQELSSYYGIDHVTTGPGNSGGPVLVLKDGTWRLAGILVSGSFFGAGAYVIDSYAKSVANSALAAAGADVPATGGTTRMSAAPLRQPLALTDGGRKYVSARVSFAQMTGLTTRVLLDLELDAQKRGDLDVYVRSPSGRVYVVAAANPDVNGTDLDLVDHDISPAFRRADPNGKWTVFCRDSEPNGLTARLQAASLKVTSL
jgi:Fe-S cluster assembly iron-binding protein IscA